MREYKFRGWHSLAKEMLYEDRVGDVFIWKQQRQPLKIMQYTGFKDCDGKEIYESDILSSGSTGYVVVWSPEHAQFFFSVINTKTTLVRNLKFPVFQYAIDGVCGVEVIGNIYEHGHLLED